MLHNKSIKIIIVIVLILIPLIIGAGDKYKLENPIGYADVGELFEAIGRFIFWLSIALVPLMVLIAAFQFFGAGDSPEKIKTAKDIMKWTLVGIAIVLSSAALYTIIRGVIDKDYDPDARLNLVHKEVIRYI